MAPVPVNATDRDTGWCYDGTRMRATVVSEMHVKVMKRAQEIVTRLEVQGLDVSFPDRTPRLSLALIHDEIEEMARQALPLMFIYKTIEQLGVKCDRRTVRRYMQRHLSDLYERNYSRTPRGLASPAQDHDTAVNQLVPEFDGSNDKKVVQKQSSSTERKYNSVQQRYMKGSHLDADKRERASPDSFFGKGMSERFDFLRTTNRKEK